MYRQSPIFFKIVQLSPYSLILHIYYEFVVVSIGLFSSQFVCFGTVEYLTKTSFSGDQGVSVIF